MHTILMRATEGNACSDKSQCSLAKKKEEEEETLQTACEMEHTQRIQVKEMRV